LEELIYNYMGISYDISTCLQELIKTDNEMSSSYF